MTTASLTIQINGVIDTANSVLENMTDIASASNAWITYDINLGKWAVVINRAGSSVASFNDRNIIGSISVSSTGLTEVYNGVEIEFPHVDIYDEPDYLFLEIPDADRYPNEPDNVLKITTNLVNDPIQAEIIASRELKQSRVDKVIQFRTDFTKLGLAAGDLISVTNEALGYTSKVFRIIRLEEEDQEDGILLLSITALEYDADVYTTAGLTRTSRTPRNDIKSRTVNAELDTKDDQSTGTTLLRLLAANAVTGLINSVFTKNPITGVITQALTPKSAQREADILSVFDNGDKAKMLKGFKLPGVVITGPSSICEGATLSLTLAQDCPSCLLDPVNYDYTITGVQAGDITFPLTGTVAVPGTMSIPIVTDASSETETMTVTVGSATKTITINDALAFTYSTSASPTSVTEGSSSTVTLTTTNVANGTVIPYIITGDTSRISTATTGTVTVNSNSATLTVNTINDSVYTGNGAVTVTFNQGLADPCNQLDKTASITIVDDESPPTTCQYISVPVVWCGQYDGNDNQLQAVTALHSMNFPVPLAGEATTTIPLTLTVTKGNPSTIAVATTATIAASHASMGGRPVNVITSFNSVIPRGLITGTTTTFYGY